MNQELIEILKQSINHIQTPRVFMEVCGTHTMAIGKMGLRNLLQDKVKLISGPGCPVCVTPSEYIDYIYHLAINEKVSIITYGDMLRVPGSRPEISLMNAKALGADVKMVYSAMDSINIALENQNRKYLFLAIGFETTIPSTCILLNEIIDKKVSNLKILSLHKKVEPVMKQILQQDIELDGFLCPGNVAVIIGEEGFEFIEKYRKVGAIAGFSEDEIIEGLIALLDCTQNKRFELINKYSKFVNKQGNLIAKNLINKYFNLEASKWRGLGYIEESGYKLWENYKNYDIEESYPLHKILQLNDKLSNKHICMCGEILKGKITPKECKSFAKICTPTFPLGPCMVSSEGTCSAYYKYERR